MSQPLDDWHMGSPTLVCPVVGEGKGTGGFSWFSNLKARKMSRFCVAKKISIFSQKSSTLFFFFLMWTNFNVFIEFGTILLLLFLCFGFFLAARHMGSEPPDQGWNLYSLYWEAKS